MKKLIGMLAMVVAVSATAQNQTEFMNVLATNGLNMRSKPEATARIVSKVAYGKRVEVLEKIDTQLKLGWITDNWYKVRYRGREGYIFGGYLSDLPAPGEITTLQLSTMLKAYTTTHFKSLQPATETIEVEGTDTLKHTLAVFENGVELEIENITDRQTASLILNASVQECYVLLEALLKQNGFKVELENLRFVKKDNGDLTRITSSNQTIFIKGFADSRAVISLTSYKPFATCQH